MRRRTAPSLPWHPTVRRNVQTHRARGAGVQRVAPGAAKRSRGLVGGSPGEPAGRATAENPVSHRICHVEAMPSNQEGGTSLGISHRFSSRTPIKLKPVARLAGSLSETLLGPRLRFAAPGATRWTPASRAQTYSPSNVEPSGTAQRSHKIARGRARFLRGAPG